MIQQWTEVPLGAIARDLTKDRTRVIDLEEQVIEPTIRTKEHKIDVAAVRIGAEVKIKARVPIAPGDLVFSRLHTQNGGFAFADREFLATGTFMPLAVDESKVDRRFLFWALHVRVPSISATSDSVGRETYKSEQILAIPIPLPPFSEQRRIAARIDELTSKIQNAHKIRQQAAAEAAVIASSTLSRIFDHEPGSRLALGWDWKPLKDLLSHDGEGMTTGPFGTLLQKSDIQQEGVPVLGIANVQMNQFVPGFSDYVTENKARSLSSYELKPGDIVIARSGTVGRSCVVPTGIVPPPIMSTNLIRLRLDHNVFLPDLLCRIFNGSRLVECHKDSECRGSSRTFFTQKILLRLRVPVPPLSEQRQILAKLKELQRQVDALQRLQAETSTELDALTPSILDRAFKGDL